MIHRLRSASSGDGFSRTRVCGRRRRSVFAELALDRRAAVEVDLLGIDLHQGHDAAAELVPDVDHPQQQRVVRVDQVVAEQHREGLVPHVLGCLEDGVAEARRVSLADVVHGGEVA